MKPLFGSKLLIVLIGVLCLPAGTSARRFFARQNVSTTKNQIKHKPNPRNNLPKHQWKPFNKNAENDAETSNHNGSTGLTEQTASGTQSSPQRRRFLPVLRRVCQTGVLIAAMTTPALFVCFASGSTQNFLQRRVLPILGGVGQTALFLAIMTPFCLLMFGPFIYLFRTFLKSLIAIHGN